MKSKRPHVRENVQPDIGLLDKHSYSFYLTAPKKANWGGIGHMTIQRLEPNCIECANELADKDLFEGICNTCAREEGIIS